MNRPARRIGSGGCTLHGLAMAVLALTAVPAAAESLSPVFVRILESYTDAGYCLNEADDVFHYTLDLGGGVTAEVLSIECLGTCGSGGCHSRIIVNDRVYGVFGSEPFQLQGARPGYDDVTAIGWFAGGGECNDDYNYQDCLYTMYWHQNAGKLMHFGAGDYTDEYADPR